MEVTGSSSLDGFGSNAYHPTNGTSQTVIIPLTRRTEELIGNIYNQYMASAPPMSMESGTPKLNGYLKRTDSWKIQNGLTHQDSTETNTSEDIKPCILKDSQTEIFTVENQMTKIDTAARESRAAKDNSCARENDVSNINCPKTKTNKHILPDVGTDTLSVSDNGLAPRSELPNIIRPRRNILEPLKREDVPSWSLAKGPCVVAMQRKAKSVENDECPESPSGSLLLTNGKKVPPVRNGLRQTSGEISTIHEGHIQSYQNTVSKATLDLFSANNNQT